MDELINYLENVPQQNISIKPSEALAEYLMCREFQRKLKEHVRRLISCACFNVGMRLVHDEEPLVYFVEEHTILVEYEHGKIVYAFAKERSMSSRGKAQSVLDCLEVVSRSLKLKLEKRDKLDLKDTELRWIEFYPTEKPWE
nr:hypothetical protein Cbor_185 [Cedratvirus borely]